MGRILTGLVVGSILAGDTIAQVCNTTTLTTSVPSDNSTNVVLSTYSYCGGTLNTTAYINNLAYNKLVTLYFTDRQGQSTPLASVGLGYQDGVNGTNWELWGSSTPVYIDGITQLLNLTYNVVDLGTVYTEPLNQTVTASGAPEPTLAAPPAPYATPLGFGDDITTWLAASNGSQVTTSYTKMFRNINPNVTGAVDGVVVAGRSGPSFDSKLPDYEYDWVRDSSLTMEVVQQLYAAATEANAKQAYEDQLFAYAAARAVEQNDPNLQTGLGEPKFYLNNTIFSGPWGRPQNDGPATAAITLIEFAESYLAAGGNQSTLQQQIYDSTAYPDTAPVQKDLLFVASNWTSTSFDLWEEQSSDHFYTRMVQRRALIMGAKFAATFNDSATVSTLQDAATAITESLDVFWDVNRGILLYEYGPVLSNKASYLDAAVILALIHGYADDGVYSYTNDRVQSTVVRFVTSFIPVYTLANTTQDSAGQVLGVPIGRYPEDIYNGTGTQVNGGNPWYLTTAAVAQYFWAASAEYTDAGSITPTNISQSFFDYFTPSANVSIGETYSSGSAEFTAVIDSLNGWGDAFMRTAKTYTPADGSLAEEYNRNTGVPQGCVDLTWSYASIITAAIQRASLRNETTFVEDLANVGFTPNK